MQDHSLDHLQTLALLAREYEQKYNELVEMSRNTAPDAMYQQLKIRAEHTTDRFRAAQQAMFSMLLPMEEPQKEMFSRAATAVSRCFDEMRVLFQVVLEFSAGRNENNPG